MKPIEKLVTFLCFALCLLVVAILFKSFPL
jgi:hypothetical protein